MRLNRRTKAMLAAATIAAAAMVALSGCGTRGTVIAGGEYGATHAGNAKRPEPHEGVDFMVPRGTKVIAPADGTVILAIHTVDPKKMRRRFDSGRQVEIMHSGRVTGMRTVYRHLGDVYVDFGDTVSEGQVIATVGVCSTGPPVCDDHLHFETVDNYIRKNPRKVIGGCLSKGEAALSAERPLYHPLKC